MNTHQLKTGWAFESSRRFPANPDMVSLNEGELEKARFVGFAHIDDTNFAAFKVIGQKRYLFQIARRCRIV
jgi:hypothetical protein